MVIFKFKDKKSPVVWSNAIYTKIYVRPVVMMKFQSIQPKAQSSSNRLYISLLKAPIPTLSDETLFINLPKADNKITIKKVLYL